MSLNGTGVDNTRASEVVQFDYERQKSGDCVDDQVMAEIAERLIGSFLQADGAEVVRSTSAPKDKTKFWLPVDASGTPVGNVLKYDAQLGQWVDSNGTPFDPVETEVILEKFETRTITSATDLTFELPEFEEGNLEYSVTVTPQFDTEIPDTDEDGEEVDKKAFYWWVDKGDQSAVVHFRNVTSPGGKVDVIFRQKSTTTIG